MQKPFEMFVIFKRGIVFNRDLLLTGIQWPTAGCQIRTFTELRVTFNSDTLEMASSQIQEPHQYAEHRTEN